MISISTKCAFFNEETKNKYLTEKFANEKSNFAGTHDSRQANK